MGLSFYSGTPGIRKSHATTEAASPLQAERLFSSKTIVTVVHYGVVAAKPPIKCSPCSSAFLGRDVFDARRVHCDVVVPL